MNHFPLRKHSAFTLVELIIVITILAILATIAFVSFQGYTKDARDSNRLATIKNIETGIELFVVKSWNTPNPDNFVNLTGSSIKQWFIWENVSAISNIKTTPKDPLTYENYIYSTTSNGKYYQIAISKENQNTSYINNSYADFSKSIVVWNYKFDPSLPSLIVVPSSVSNSGIFDQNVCFVVNGWVNNVKNCYEKKSSMTMNAIDKNLVWYWDTDIYYQKNYNGIANTLFLKDLSGNSYDMIGKKSDTVFLTGTITSSWSIFESWGVRFDKNGNFQYYFNTMSTTSWWINEVDKDVFLENVTASWWDIIPGITIKAYVFHNINDTNGTKRILTFNKGNDGNINSWDVLKNIDANLLRFNGKNIESAVAAYNDGLITNQNIYGMYGCWDNNNAISLSDRCLSKYFNINNNYDWNILFYVVFNFKENKHILYENGKQVYIGTINYNDIKRIQEWWYKKASFRLSSSTETFIGKIYELGIYSRALSESEIIQQSSILWY